MAAPNLSASDRAPGWRPGKAEWATLAGLGVLVVYVINAWTPSHYGVAAGLLGLDHAGPIFGQAREIRSDDWALTTPFFQIAVASHLGPVELASPFHQSLATFFALPSRDWSMAFKPDLWGFLVLDPAHAFSLHFAILAAAMLAGFAIVLRQLGCTPGFAFAGTAMIFFSQFVQAWWTSNAPVLAWAAWPVAAYLWSARWYFRLPAISYAVAVWLIGQPYLPFVVAAGVAFGFAILAFRPDALGWGGLVTGVLAAGLGAAVAWLHFADLIPVMRDTVYPGHRRSGGGGMRTLQLLEHLFPYLLTSDLEPLDSLWPSNACEIAVVGSFLPLATATFAEHRALLAWVRARRTAIVIWLVGVDLLAAWVVLPIPGGDLIPILNQAPGYRMAWGLGVLFLIGFLIAGSSAHWVFTWRRVAVFAGVVIAAWAASKLAGSTEPFAAGRFDLVILAILAWLLLARLAAPRLLPARRIVLLAVAGTAVITFGQFNPVQPAGPIFDRRPSSPVLETLRSYAAANPRGWAILPGWYGATITGAGVPAINHILLRPDLTLFRAAYPSLSPGAINLLFNRYEHLIPDVRWRPELLNDDVVAIPPDPFAIPLMTVATATPAKAGTGHLDDIEAIRLGERRWGIVAQGWAPWRGVDASQTLAISAPPSLGRIVSASGYRLPRPDIVVQLREPAAFAAGFGLRAEVETSTSIARFPTDALVIAPVDQATSGQASR